LQQALALAEPLQHLVCLHSVRQEDFCVNIHTTRPSAGLGDIDYLDIVSTGHGNAGNGSLVLLLCVCVELAPAVGHCDDEDVKEVSRNVQSRDCCTKIKIWA
jgi:hypothetical protein